MKRNNEKDNKEIVDDKEHQNVDGLPKSPGKIDPMGTEVMQEDIYQEKKHGELPVEDQKKTTEK